MNASNDYAKIFIEDIPLIDTRAPIEYEKGSFACATNLPLMDNSERARVGTCYKKNGQQAAIELGHQLVTGQIKQERVEQWLNFVKQNPQGLLFCFRGGLRSRITQQWLSDAGVDYPRIEGGYKALRTFLINTIEQCASECSFTVLTGLTGTGKTDLLVELPYGVDLEGHANHRGSSFGKHATSQPSQINFENALAIDFLKKRHQGYQHFVLENEGKLVGACNVPITLRRVMQQAPMVMLAEELDARIERILRDYVVNLHTEFLQQDPLAGDTAYSERLQKSLKNISKRLGGERYQRLSKCMQEALDKQLNKDDVAQHRDWIRALLEEYYDPMYLYQRHAMQEHIVFSGNQTEVKEYLDSL